MNRHVLVSSPKPTAIGTERRTAAGSRRQYLVPLSCDIRYRRSPALPNVAGRRSVGDAGRRSCGSGRSGAFGRHLSATGQRASSAYRSPSTWASRAASLAVGNRLLAVERTCRSPSLWRTRKGRSRAGLLPERPGYGARIIGHCRDPGPALGGRGGAARAAFYRARIIGLALADVGDGWPWTVDASSQLVGLRLLGCSVGTAAHRFDLSARATRLDRPQDLTHAQRLASLKASVAQSR
jgi:hypothetical protein